MTNQNEITSIETLSDDELSLVSGGCYGKYYRSYKSWGYAAGGGGNGGGGRNDNANANVNQNDVTNVNSNVNELNLTLIIDG